MMTSDEERALLALDQETIEAIGLAHSGHVTPAEGETFDPGEGDHSRYVSGRMGNTIITGNTFVEPPLPPDRPPDHTGSEVRPAHDCPDCTHVAVVEIEWWDMPDGSRVWRERHQDETRWSAWIEAGKG